MGYQEYLVTARNKNEFRQFISLCTDWRSSKDHAFLQPRSVVEFKQPVGKFPAGTQALWVTGDRIHGDIRGALIPEVTRKTPRIISTPADNADAIGIDGDYTKGIDLSGKTDISENEYMKRYSFNYYYKHYCAPDKDAQSLSVYLKVHEFMRRLTAEGYTHDLDELGAGAVRYGDQRAFVMDDGEIRCPSQCIPFAYRIRDLRDEVLEYTTAFEKALPDKKNGNDVRTLFKCNNCELAARRLPDNSIDFVTWVMPNGHRDLGHYFNDYSKAKQDFAVRAGLIDRNMLFSETELTVIRSNLSDFLSVDSGDHITGENEQAIKGIIKKIDDVVVPEIAEQVEEAEAEGYEPEHEL